MEILKKRRDKFIRDGIYSKRAYNIKFWALVLYRVPGIVQILFWSTLAAVVAIEVFSPDNSRTWPTKIINNLSYNTLAGCVFYFLTFHLPQEQKKVKLINYINNKTVFLLIQIDNLFKTLIEHSEYRMEFESLSMQNIDAIYKKIGVEDVNKMTMKASPFTQVVSQFEFASFENWIIYWNWKVKRVKACVNELTPYHELLSSDFLKYLTWIEFQFSRMDYILNVYNNRNNNSLHLFAASFEYLLKYKGEMSKVLRKDFGVLAFRLHSFEFSQQNKEWEKVRPEDKD